ncbi:hypothetical protein W97_06116 [Coniosporium apollinis CBS 100218]|uniref:DUF7908 domain-containing protein n=1 Tax=Coniosporium apollinis (strain CBS 100218) TaxID=1168221 RepID=R7YYI0_CONA1|nr:uncharacterized protein W97_06116 [Coniosporium apollinis CBS 100218]EON67000.1 hypothetical protein W97_06116 [Coniosporium apollinis CBS 100218]
MANGNTTTNASMAAEFRILDSRLYVNGIKMSVAPGVRSMPFAVDSNPGSIDTSFSVNSGGLSWTDSAFTNSTAQFYKVPPEEIDNALLLVQFIGEPDPELGLSPINMAAQRREEAIRQESLMSSMVMEPTQTTIEEPPFSSAWMGISSSGVWVSPPASSAVPTQSWSPDGACGATNGGFMCSGAPDGECCSPYGYW